MGDLAVRCLSIHAAYRCRDAGACCTAGWPIPVEADRLVGLQHALASGQLRLADGRRDGRGAFQWPADAPTETPAVLGLTSQACVFYRSGGSGRCEIHRALGHAALPLACRQFPRVSLLDARGTSLTLSHYCPTAAAMLDTREPVSIVADPRGFPAGGEYIGLDVRDDLPPSLRPDMLMDWEAWWTWEALCVETLAHADSARHALAETGAIVEDVRSWRPDDGALADRICEAFARRRVRGDGSQRPRDHDVRLAEVLDAIPAGLRPTSSELRSGGSRSSPGVVRNFLAAHAFANWTAHLGEGLRTWHRSVEAAFALLEVGLDVRMADLLLRHLADPSRLARTWSQAERD